MKILNEKDLKNVVGGKLSEAELNSELLLIANDYPEVQAILDAFDNKDLGTYYILLSNLEYDHPELGYLFQ